MQFSDEEISTYTGIPLGTLVKIRQDAVREKKSRWKAKGQCACC